MSLMLKSLNGIINSLKSWLNLYKGSFMLSTYKEKIIKEIGRIPDDKMPKLYKVIHVLTTELISETKKAGVRGSLKGVWKGSRIDESLFTEARKSLFPYESR